MEIKINKNFVPPMADERDYFHPSLTDEMRKYGCYVVKGASAEETRIILTPEFIANTEKGFSVKTDVGFGVERVASWKRDANGNLTRINFPDRLTIAEEAGDGHFSVDLTINCECGNKIPLSYSQMRVFIRGAFESIYADKVITRCPKCGKLIFKP